MTGQCTRFDQNGIRCTRINNTVRGFQQHDAYHAKSYACAEPRCHMEYSAFDHADPHRALTDHQASHNDDTKKTMYGCTKLDRGHPCDRLNSANGKLCSFSFSDQGHLKYHQKDHRQNWRCDVEGCLVTFSAFTHRHPSEDLIRHRISHNLKSVKCEHCGAWFEDTVQDGAKFECSKQLAAHRMIGGRCFNFQAPINYVFFTCATGQSMVDSLIAYSGRSDVGLGRPFAQPAALWRNFQKTANDPARDKKMAKTYEQTARNGNGMYLMTVHQQPVTDSVSSEAACQVVADSEAASECALI